MARRIVRLVGKCALGGCVAITLFDCVGHPAMVVGASMAPTLQGEDSRWTARDFVWLTPWGAKEAVRGDIVTFIPPRNPDKLHIKRVAAVENEFVKPKKHEMLMMVPSGHLWMESDNPENAYDSNIYGPVSRGLVHNRATHIIWPPSRWQRLN